MTDHHFFSKFTKLFNNIIFRNRFVACTHTPRQNKDDSTFEQGSNKTVIVIKNKNAISGCHGNQHSRTPGNVVKHATEHKAAKQVKRLFIRLQHVVQCPLVRAQERHKRVQNWGRRCKYWCPARITQELSAWQLHKLAGRGTRPGSVQSDGEVMPGHAPTPAFISLLREPSAPQRTKEVTQGTGEHLSRWDPPTSAKCCFSCRG